MLINFFQMSTKEPAKKKIKERIQQEFYNLDKYDNKVFFGKYLKASEPLTEVYTPKDISCRDEQKQCIRDFIKRGIMKNGMQQCLYISGVPGIGKTLCVREIMDGIEQQEKLSGNHKKNAFIYLNAMQIRYQADIFKALLNKLTGQKTDSVSALYRLEDFFKKAKGYPEYLYVRKVIVIDEIDYLTTKDQQVLYTLFEWMHSANSRIILIAISNTIDFPQSLTPKILSRIGNQRLIFKPYNSSQIETILRQRIEIEENVFEDKSVEYICKKIAKCSSDIRKCISVLRESIFLYLDGKDRKTDGLIPLNILIKAHEKVYRDTFHDIYFQLPLSYKQVLNCLAQHFRFETHSIGLRQLRNRVKTLYSLTDADVKQVAFALKDLGIISIKFSNKVASQAKKKKLKHLDEEHITLNIEVDKILFAANKEGNQQVRI